MAGYDGRSFVVSKSAAEQRDRLRNLVAHDPIIEKNLGIRFPEIITIRRFSYC